MKEGELLAPSVRELLHAKIIRPDDLMATEVPVAGKRIDVAFVRGTDSSVLCLELKISNWKQVTTQAIRSRAWSHRIYVGISSVAIPSAYEDTYGRFHIGVIGAGRDKMKVLRRSAREKPASPALLGKVRDYVRREGREVRTVL